MKARSPLSLAALAEAIPARTLIGDAATPIAGVACNTELGDVQPGVLFAPLDLPAPMAAAVAARAVAAGAGALLVKRRLDIAVPQLVVPNPRAALAQAAAAYYGHPAREIGCIGVTGTDGKTTTTLLIDAILRPAGLRPGLVGSLEWRVGEDRFQHQTLQTTPESPAIQRVLRRMVDAGDRWAILESTSHGLALHRLDAIPFAIGAITFVTQDHLDFHGSIAAYRRAKAILFEHVATSAGTAVINADDPASREMRAYCGAARVVTYGLAGAGADFRATDLVAGPSGTRFILSTSDEQARVHLPLLGEFNVANALCAAAVAQAAGASLDQIVHGLSSASPIPGLLARVDAGQPFLVLVDEAKSIPQLVAAIEVARQLTPTGRVIVLAGGTDRFDAALNRQKGEVAALAADYLVATTQLARFTDPAPLVAQVAAGARVAGGMAGVTFVSLVDRREAVAHALRLARQGDCVLLTGKGVEDTLTVHGVPHPWNETAVARAALAEMGYVVP